MSTHTSEKCTVCEGFGFIDHGNGNSHTCMQCDGTGRTLTPGTKTMPTSNELTPKQLAAVLRTLARGYHVDSGALEALNAAALIVEKATPAHETRATAEETGWLIELAIDGRPHWLQVSSVREWTADANDAVRFAREADADAMLAFLGLEGARATGHTWCDPPKITPRDYTDAAMRAGLPPPTQRDIDAMNAVIAALYGNRANEKKAGEQRHGAAQDFVSFDPQGGVWIDMARYLRSPAGQAQLQALGGKKAKLGDSFSEKE